MRNLLIPIAIVLAVAVFITCNLIIITDNAAKLDAVLVVSKEKAEKDDFEGAKIEIENFQREFERVEKYLFAVVMHNEVDDIIFSSNRLYALCGAETKEQFLAELEVTRRSIMLIRDAEIPYLENIL